MNVLKKNVKPKLKRAECSGCLKWKDTRQLNFKWQSFTEKYKKPKWDKTGTRSAFYIYHTANFSMCRSCMKVWLKQLAVLQKIK